MRLAGVEGEIKMVRDTLNVDPDGALGVEPFTVQCSTNDTVIDRPTPSLYYNRDEGGRERERKSDKWKPEREGEGGSKRK